MESGQDINKATPKPVPQEGLGRLFGLVWPDLETTVAEAKKNAPTSEEPSRKPDEMLEELVTRVRRVEFNPLRPSRRLTPGDVIMLPGGEILTVPDDLDSAAKIERSLVHSGDLAGGGLAASCTAKRVRVCDTASHHIYGAPKQPSTEDEE
jgi:hypothetical protein